MFIAHFNSLRQGILGHYSMLFNVKKKGGGGVGVGY